MTKRRISILLYKEFLTSCCVFRRYLLLLLVYFSFGVLGIVDLLVVLLLTLITPFMTVYSLFYQDDETNFLYFSSLFPQGKVLVPLARYLYTCFLVLPFALFSLIFLLFAGDFTPYTTEELLYVCIGLLCCGFFLSAILFPLTYFLGSSRSKPWFCLLILGSFSLFILFRQVFFLQIAENQVTFLWVSTLELSVAALLLFLLSLLLFLLSLLLSIRILEKKSFIPGK